MSYKKPYGLKTTKSQLRNLPACDAGSIAFRVLPAKSSSGRSNAKKPTVNLLKRIAYDQITLNGFCRFRCKPRRVFEIFVRHFIDFPVESREGGREHAG